MKITHDSEEEFASTAFENSNSYIPAGLILAVMAAVITAVFLLLRSVLATGPVLAKLAVLLHHPAVPTHRNFIHTI